MTNFVNVKTVSQEMVSIVEVSVIEYEVGHRPGLGSVICGAYMGLYIAIQGISDYKLC